MGHVVFFLVCLFVLCSCSALQRLCACGVQRECVTDAVHTLYTQPPFKWDVIKPVSQG